MIMHKLQDRAPTIPPAIPTHGSINQTEKHVEGYVSDKLKPEDEGAGKGAKKLNSWKGPEPFAHTSYAVLYCWGSPVPF